jgi:hypothetical protein
VGAERLPKSVERGILPRIRGVVETALGDRQVGGHNGLRARTIAEAA